MKVKDSINQSDSHEKTATFKETLGRVNQRREEMGVAQLDSNCIYDLSFGDILDTNAASRPRSYSHYSGSTDDTAVEESLDHVQKLMVLVVVMILKQTLKTTPWIVTHHITHHLNPSYRIIHEIIHKI